MLRIAAKVLIAAAIGKTLAAAQINVGNRVLVSHGEANINHVEVTSAADPNNSGRLVACSILTPVDEAGAWTAAYVSFDDGKTFSKTVEQRSLINGRLEVSADPTCAYGTDGSAYFAALSNSGFDARTLFFKSPDGGHTWLPPVSLFGAWDRPFIAVDHTAGKNRGRIYVSHNYRAQNFDPPQPQQFNSAGGIGLQRSLDGGATFQGPTLRLGLSGMQHQAVNAENTVVLSDGTTITLFFEGDPVPRRGSYIPDMDGSLKVLSSSDGGESFADATKIADHFEDRNRSTKSTLPNIAVDPGSQSFKDRLYVAWHDSALELEEGFVSYSSDHGKTWSTPTRIGSHTNDVFQTTVAVNKRGVVGLMWYEAVPGTHGYAVRFTASTDGGQSWLTPVAVSEQAPMNPDEKWMMLGKAAGKDPVTVRIFRYLWQSSGDTAGLTADSYGTFHAFWIDNRTGIGQVWTAPILVSDRVFRNGSADLDQLDDVSGLTELQLSHVSFDPAGETLSTDLRVKNTSDRQLDGTLQVRIFNVESELCASVVALPHDGQKKIVDFFPDNAQKNLRSGEISPEKNISFQLHGVHDCQEGHWRPLLKFNARVFSHVRK